MNGLKRLVHMRGGLQSLGWDGILHTFISWYDIILSWLELESWLDPLGKKNTEL